MFETVKLLSVVDPRVEVMLTAKMLPPVMVRPDADERPPFVEIAMPPEKEEVAVLVMFKRPEERMEPPVRVRPFEEERPPALVEEIPPAKVEVALLPTIVVVAVPPIAM